MMKNLLTTLMVLLIVMAAGSAMAGAILKISDEASINLGYRVQVLGINTDEDLDNDGSFDRYRNFGLRRARFRLQTTINEHVSAFLQTDVAGGGKEMQLIDALIVFKVNPWLQFYTGRNMSPANRQNVTSSGALMAMDRPGIIYKSLTWGTRALHTFSTKTYGGSSVSGMGENPQAVRDMGITLFGTGDLGSNGHLKYYAGIYNGIQAATNEDNTAATTVNNDKDRITLRAQYNLWDAEAAYFNSSTYLGKKKTLGIGVSYDTQKEVAESTDLAKPMADYTYMSADLFFEYPTRGGNAWTAEFGWMNLDFDDNTAFMNAQGSGFYGQAGYYLASGWQPWVEFESFDSDATSTTAGTEGKFSNFRVGVTYFLEGQHANIKLGYESFKSDTPIVGTEDTINSVVLGFYTNY